MAARAGRRRLRLACRTLPAAMSSGDVMMLRLTRLSRGPGNGCTVGGHGCDQRCESECRGHHAEGVGGRELAWVGDPAEVQGAECGDADCPGDLQAGCEYAADVGRIAWGRRRGEVCQDRAEGCPQPEAAQCQHTEQER